MPFINCDCGELTHWSVMPDWYETRGKYMEQDEKGLYKHPCLACWKKLTEEQKQELESKFNK